jgi:hypothetical protein
MNLVILKLWDPKIFLQSFEHSVTCSDTWNNCLVLGTNNGVFVIDGKLLIDLSLFF